MYMHRKSVWKLLIYTRLTDVLRVLNEDSSGDTTRLAQCHSYCIARCLVNAASRLLRI